MPAYPIVWASFVAPMDVAGIVGGVHDWSVVPQEIVPPAFQIAMANSAAMMGAEIVVEYVPEHKACSAQGWCFDCLSL